MYSVRQRACGIIATTVSAFLTLAMLAAATTILRDLVLRPRPVVTEIRVSRISPLYDVRAPTLLSPEISDASVYYLPGSGDAKTLPLNIAVVDTEGRAGDTEQVLRRKQWHREHIPAGFQLGLRTHQRIILYLSGSMDFHPCWDWNTKAIFLSMVARFSSATVRQNEVVLLDGVLRSVSLPAPMKRLAALRRQERRAAAALVSGQQAKNSPALMTEAERSQLAAFESSLRNRDHEHPSIHLDHIDKLVVLNESFKYFVDAFDDTSLTNNTVELVLRYQVMSYSGWAPLREEVLGHRVAVRTPTVSVPWDEKP